MRADQIIELRDLRFNFPEAQSLQDILDALKKIVDPENESKQKIYKTSKSSFIVQFDKGLCIWAKFLFNKKIVKRII